MTTTSSAVATSAPTAPSDRRTNATPRGLELNLAELLRERELLAFFAWRNIQIRYKQSIAGPGWAIINPLLNMLVFTVVFGRYAKLPSDGVPYPVFYIVAFVLWTYFGTSVAMGAVLLADNSALVSKVYFPRIFLPVSAAVSGLVDLAIATAITIPLMLVYGVAIRPRFLLLIGPVAVAAFAVAGASMFFSALNAKYRDVRFIVPVIIQVGLFASPVAYSSSIVPQNLHTLYGINPMAGAIEGARWCVAGRSGVTIAMFAVSALSALAMFVVGFLYFQRVDANIADII